VEFIKVIERQIGFVSLKLQIIWMGNDICLILTGGERPHIGAVAVAQIRASLQHKEQVSSTVSNITLLGHKEDEIARKIASAIAVKANSNVVVCCGIHSDNLTQGEIGDILDACQELLEDAIDYIVNTVSL
jgi:hypothetical protein